MRGQNLWTLVLLAATVGCGPNDQQAPTPPVDVDAERAAIQEAWDGVNAAFVAGEWETYSEYFVPAQRFRMIHPGSREWLSGAVEFADAYRVRVQNGGGWDVSTELFEINLGPAGDVAWTNAEVALSSGGSTFTAWQLTVWEKSEGRWRVSSAMSSTLPPTQDDDSGS